MLNTAVITSVLIDITKNQIVFLSDSEEPKYLYWDDAETFLYMWNLIDLEKDKYDLFYTFDTKPKSKKQQQKELSIKAKLEQNKI